ncbi:MAG: hypothetical protein ACPGWR_29220 [Ardenticatenaceae bacterium]
MNTVKALHREAMVLAQMAFVAELNDHSEDATELNRQAFEKEAAAAKLVFHDFSLEPTRSVLHRSAAVLAIECGELREAERLISAGLAGNPPIEIAEELRELLEQVYRERASLRQISWKPSKHDPYQLNGQAVGLDLAHGQNLNNVTMTGELKFADSLNGSQGQIKIVDENGHKHLIVVPLSMMSDIVKPLYEETVMVTGKPVGEVITLEEIVKV